MCQTPMAFDLLTPVLPMDGPDLIAVSRLEWPRFPTLRDLLPRVLAEING